MCVLVHSNKSLSDDLLMLHFENPKRSGGGDVKCIRRGDASSDVIIEFSDRKGAYKTISLNYKNVHRLLYAVYYFRENLSS